MIKRLVKSAAQAWKDDLEQFVIKNQCVSKLEDAVDLNKPDFTDCAVEGWWFHDCGQILMWMRNIGADYYWRFNCCDWNGFFDNENIMGHFFNNDSVNYNAAKKQSVIRFLCNDREHSTNCCIDDTPFDILDFLDISYHTNNYGVEAVFKNEFEEVDEILLAKTQYEELVDLIRGMGWLKIMAMDIENVIRCEDDTEDFGLFGYIYYKNCRFQIYEDDNNHNLYIDRFNIDVYSECSYHCDGDSVCDRNIGDFLTCDSLVTNASEVNTIKISQESLDNFKQECEVAKNEEEPKQEDTAVKDKDVFYDSMMAIIDNQRLLIIEKIKQRILEGKNIRDWVNHIEVLADKTGWDWTLDCHEFSELKISREHMLSGSSFDDHIEPGDVYIYDAEPDDYINLTTLCVESLLKIYSAMR